jgi:hypothetical protein
MGGANGLSSILNVAIVPINVGFCKSVCVDLKCFALLDAVLPLEPGVIVFYAIDVLKTKPKVGGSFLMDGVAVGDVAAQSYWIVNGVTSG